jgi:Lon protease-like protein
MLSLQIFEDRYIGRIKRCQQQQLRFGVAWIQEGSEFRCPAKCLLFI